MVRLYEFIVKLFTGESDREFDRRVEDRRKAERRIG